MQIRQTVAAIEDGLRAVGAPERAEGEKRYLKSDLEFLGATVPQIRKQAQGWIRSHPDVDHDQLIRLVKVLWRTRVHELRSFGVELLLLRVDILVPKDLEVTEWMLGRAKTWAHVDAIAVHGVGPLVERCPDLSADLDRWARDEDFWLRRSALLAHLLALRRGGGEWARFTGYADGMMEEKEFFIRKAIGWVLREAGRATPERVVDYLESRLLQISGLSLREGVKHVGAEDRERLMAAYRAR